RSPARSRPTTSSGTRPGGCPAARRGRSRRWTRASTTAAARRYRPQRARRARTRAAESACRPVCQTPAEDPMKAPSSDLHAHVGSLFGMVAPLRTFQSFMLTLLLLVVLAVPAAAQGPSHDDTVRQPEVEGDRETGQIVVTAVDTLE